MRHRLITESLLRDVQLARSEDIEYVAADGQKVYGLLTRPATAARDQKLPTVLWIHGRPCGQDEHAFDSERQVFAGAGYA